MKKQKELGFTISQVNNALLIREAKEEFSARLIGLSLIVLRDRYGFGRKRLTAFAKEVMQQFRCVENGLVSIEEINKTIEQETGLNIMEYK